MLASVTSLLAALNLIILGAAALPNNPISCNSSISQPNPIASTYFANVTGTINGTLAVLPITLDEAREIVGPNYAILTAAYRELLPDFPDDMYPAIIQAVLDHDIRFGGLKLPDFTRISIEYPFLDLLNDGHTSFRLSLNQTLTAGSIGLTGSAAYGTNAYPATFDPACDAYAPDSRSHGTRVTSLTAYPLDVPSPNITSAVSFATLFDTVPDDGTASPYPLSFFVNVTNQMAFADPAHGCNRQVRMFDTAVTRAPFEPVAVRGSVWAAAPFFPLRGGRAWDHVWGVRVDTAFIEENHVPCGGGGNGPD